MALERQCGPVKEKPFHVQGVNVGPDPRLFDGEDAVLH